MKNFYVLADALGFIENNLDVSITQEDIASASFVSLSSLQKLFRYTFNYSLKEYIMKRRLTCAAKDLLKTEISVTDTAIAYQFNSVETFSRAFKNLWGESPSAYRKKWKFADIFPKLKVDLENGTFIGFHIDVSELHDKLQESNGTFVICFDVVDLIPINRISREAGDFAILEAVKRITKHIHDSMLLFRIGGDEFALLSHYENAGDAENLTKEILVYNGGGFKYADLEIPVVLRAWINRYESNALTNSDLTDRFKMKLKNMKKTKEDYIIE